jgi:hypothetical protein
MQPTLALIKLVKTKKNVIFYKNDVPNRMLGPIHAFLLAACSKGYHQAEHSAQKRENQLVN